jgi:HipA-like protein
VPLVSFPVRRVLAALRGGSSLPVIVETAAGRFVTKLRGAAQGSSALAAEVIVAELAEALGLPVPQRALIELTEPIRSDDRNDELAALLTASLGHNLGFRWLDKATVLTPLAAAQLDDEFALRVLWLDALVMNIDRTASNPNILISRGQPWLIDHGAALAFQYDWGRVTEDSPREPSDHRLHLFGARRQLLPLWDANLANLLTRQVLTRIVAQVPDAFLEARPAEWSAERARAAYVAFLWKRLRAPRPFVTAD